jgi:uncharacterized membrane protein
MTDVLGIPIPSDDPLFLGVVALHVIAGLAAVASGLTAMLATKGRGRHSNAGTIYFWCLAALFGTATLLSAMRWAEDYHLFLLGALAFGSGVLGRAVIARHWDLRFHVAAMGTSFVVLLTAFYVDNGPNLPIWRELPRIAYWTVPAIVAVPIILWAFMRHPLLRSPGRYPDPTTPSI